MLPRKEFKFIHFFLVLVFFVLMSGTFGEKDITISVVAGTEECFYETLKVNQVIDMEYQVIDGGQTSFDISFYIMTPNGRTLVMDVKKPESSHRIEVNEDGDHKFCFDNRYSTFSSKTVYFELIIEGEDGADVDLWDEVIPKQSVEMYEIAIQDIEETVKRVKSHLVKVRHLQEAVRALAARDKNILEAYAYRVNSWSMIQIFVMVLVGAVQVTMVKSLFDERSKLHKLWKTSLS